MRTLLKNWNNYVSTGIWSKGPQTMADTLRRAISDVSGWELTAPDKATEKLAIEKFTGSPLELAQKAVDVWKSYPAPVPGTGHIHCLPDDHRGSQHPHPAGRLLYR